MQANCNSCRLWTIVGIPSKAHVTWKMSALCVFSTLWPALSQVQHARLHCCVEPRLHVCHQVTSLKLALVPVGVVAGGTHCVHWCLGVAKHNVDFTLHYDTSCVMLVFLVTVLWMWQQLCSLFNMFAGSAYCSIDEQASRACLSITVIECGSTTTFQQRLCLHPNSLT